MPLRFTRREEDVIEVISNLITTLTHSVLDFFVFVRRPYNLNFLRHQNDFATYAPHRFKQFRLSRNFRVKCVRASFFFVSIKICVYINNYWIVFNCVKYLTLDGVFFFFFTAGGWVYREWSFHVWDVKQAVILAQSRYGLSPFFKVSIKDRFVFLFFFSFEYYNNKCFCFLEVPTNLEPL